MKKTLFITGFPGFLAADLIGQLLHDHGKEMERIYLLVLEKEQSHAEAKLSTMIKLHGWIKDLFIILTGDITKPNLGLREKPEHITHVFHLAAVYDLAVPLHIAELVNIHGTNCVNEWVATLPHLQRYIYFSTAYVSGKREGRIYEDELNKGQSFRNHYEHTKYEAELLVDRIKATVPLTIIRPAVVKGHAETGKTIKFDGLYMMLNFYEALRHLPVIPYLKDGPPPEGNFISSDYLLRATSYLAMHPAGQGKTYHLTDPAPLNMMELQCLLMEHYLGRKPKGILPVKLASKSLQLKPVRKWLGVEAEAMDYFIYQSSYDATQALQDLEGSGINCPPLASTIPSMVAFYRKYKDDRTMHIPID